ncbi:MAG: D-alanyl-D-alanine carboxypeptidase [Enterococcus sp.]|nr:D-alanyl-D-alanine carboxypeptidase [Enterococcus sp.]
MCKKIIPIAIAFCLIFLLVPNFAMAQDYSCGNNSRFPEIEAKNALLVDEDGFVYLERNSHDSVKIASVTKVMTAICVYELLERGMASKTDMLAVSQNAAEVGESTSNLQENDKLSIHDCLLGMMVSSGNDAATVLAEGLNLQAAELLQSEAYNNAAPQNAKQSYKDFVRMMNYMAQKLELENSYFENPHGLDLDDFVGDLHSTASDVIKMTKFIMKNPDFSEIVKTTNTTLNIDRNGSIVEDKLASTNILLTNYEGVCGVKTGHTEYAGYCLDAAADIEGKRLYSIVLGCSSSETRFRDTVNMYNWYYNHVCEVKLCDTKTKLGNKKVVAYVPHFEYLDKKYAAGIEDDNKTIKVFEYKGEIRQDIQLYDNAGDIVKNQLVGQINYYQNDELIHTEKLFALEDSNAPGTFAKIPIYFQQIFLGITGNQFFAEMQVNNKLDLGDYYV